MDIHDQGAAAFDGFGRWLFRSAMLLALVGAIVMVAVVLLSLVSLVGRKLWAHPITGDVEMVQMLCAPASACFFAYCHLMKGDVRVDIVAEKLGSRTAVCLEALGSLLLGLVAALLAWRTAAGALALRDIGETSALLAWPVWLSQAFVVPGFVLEAAAGLYMAMRSVASANGRSA